MNGLASGRPRYVVERSMEAIYGVHCKTMTARPKYRASSVERTAPMAYLTPANFLARSGNSSSPFRDRSTEPAKTRGFLNTLPRQAGRWIAPEGFDAQNEGVRRCKVTRQRRFPCRKSHKAE